MRVEAGSAGLPLATSTPRSTLTDMVRDILKVARHAMLQKYLPSQVAALVGQLAGQVGQDNKTSDMLSGTLPLVRPEVVRTLKPCEGRFGERVCIGNFKGGAAIPAIYLGQRADEDDQSDHVVLLEALPPDGLLNPERMHRCCGLILFTVPVKEPILHVGPGNVSSIKNVTDLLAHVDGTIFVSPAEDEPGLPATLLGVSRCEVEADPDRVGAEGGPRFALHVRANYDPRNSPALGITQDSWQPGFATIHDIVPKDDGMFEWTVRIRADVIDNYLNPDPRVPLRPDGPSALRHALKGEFLTVAGHRGVCVGHALSPLQRGKPDVVEIFVDSEGFFDKGPIKALTQASQPGMRPREATHDVGGLTLQGFIYSIPYVTEADTTTAVQAPGRPQQSATFTELQGHTGTDAYVYIDGQRMRLVGCETDQDIGFFRVQGPSNWSGHCIKAEPVKGDKNSSEFLIAFGGYEVRIEPKAGSEPMHDSKRDASGTARSKEPAPESRSRSRKRVREAQAASPRKKVAPSQQPGMVLASRHFNDMKPGTALELRRGFGEYVPAIYKSRTGDAITISVENPEAPTGRMDVTVAAWQLRTPMDG